MRGWRLAAWSSPGRELRRAGELLSLRVVVRPLLRQPAKEVRRAQDRSIGAMYDLFREVNAQVGNLASALLAGSARPHDARGARRA